MYNKSVFDSPETMLEKAFAFKHQRNQTQICFPLITFETMGKFNQI